MTAKEYNDCVDSFSDNLYRFILKNMKDSENAKDVVQEAFTRLWSNHADINFQKAKSYLFTTAYRCMVDVFRKEKRLDKNELTESEQGSYSQYSDAREILNQACNLLPEIQKSAILLRDYEGYSYEEIGGILGLNESQVKVYIFRGRKFLKNYIGKMENVI